jgi:hypothetical protein
MKYEIKSLGLWAFIRVAFIVNLFAGFLAGLVAIPFMAVFIAAIQGYEYLESGAYIPDDGVLGFLLVGIPLFYALGSAVMGTLFQTLVVLAYNLIARLVGGFEVNMEPLQQTGPTAQAPVASAPTQPVHFPPPPPPPPPPTEPRPDLPPETP